MRTFTRWKDLLQPGSARDFFSRDPLPRFDPGAKEYDWQDAWWLAELCRLVYRHDVEEDDPPPLPARSAFLAQAGLRQVAFFNSPETGTQAFLVQSDRPPAFAALVFRGTEQDPRDFMSDLEFPPVPLDEGRLGRVHRGFLDALRSVWDPISTALSGVGVPIFYAGHSLGAALATLAAARRPPEALYTFGSPLVGDSDFAALLSQVPVFRVVDGSDLVTRVPPEELGFAHVGEEHRLVPSPGPSPFRQPLAWLRTLLGPPPPLADHAPINYLERLAPRPRRARD
jgi:triacylglycerol lipase